MIKEHRVRVTADKQIATDADRAVKYQWIFHFHACKVPT